MTIQIEIEELTQEIERYLAAVEVFRGFGCEPRWQIEIAPLVSARDGEHNKRVVAIAARPRLEWRLEIRLAGSAASRLLTRTPSTFSPQTSSPARGERRRAGEVGMGGGLSSGSRFREAPAIGSSAGRGLSDGWNFA